MKNLGRLALRVTVGGLFVGHGTQKLFGWFDGHGIDNTAQMFDAIGMRPGRRNAYAAGAAEAGGGALLALGAATPLAAGTLTSTMLIAIHRVHLKNGPWVTKSGYEYNLVLIAACLALADDRETGKGALKALLLGIAGAAGAHLAAEAAAPDPEPVIAGTTEPPAAAEAA